MWQDLWDVRDNYSWHAGYSLDSYRDNCIKYVYRIFGVLYCSKRRCQELQWYHSQEYNGTNYRTYYTEVSIFGVMSYQNCYSLSSSCFSRSFDFLLSIFLHSECFYVVCGVFVGNLHRWTLCLLFTTSTSFRSDYCFYYLQ